jgi:hypothetical protein
MRKNCEAVMEAWNNNEPEGKPGSAVWTDGDHVYSYQTCVLAYREGGHPLEPEAEDAVIVLNASKYSVTTSGHQTAIAGYLNVHFMGDFVAYAGFPFGATPAELLDRYDEED